MNIQKQIIHIQTRKFMYVRVPFMNFFNFLPFHFSQISRHLCFMADLLTEKSSHCTTDGSTILSDL